MVTSRTSFPRSAWECILKSNAAILLNFCIGYGFPRRIVGTRVVEMNIEESGYGH